ncbi:Ig-like domain-containing protein [Shewanella atlantica]|uniref:Ig-like domain-containing protein n=1 Tax=Shewanella atlantica TaxID=271099 RepID=UPI00373703DD
MTKYKLLVSTLFISFFSSLLTQASAHAATPALTNGLPAASFAGEQVCFDVGFSNSDTTPGFGPYIRLDFPSEITLDSASFLGSGVTVTNVGSFPVSGSLTDPKTGSIVSSEQGRGLSLLTLPLGSVVKDGPELAVNVCATLDTSVVVGTPLSVGVQGVFEYGDTATGDNGAIEGTLISKSVTPTVILFQSSNNAPEAENVPGSAFKFSVTDKIDVANGKTAFDLKHQNSLDAALQYHASSATGGVGFVKTAEPLTSAPGGIFTSNFTSITGTAAGNDASVSYTAYITDILDESQCGTQLLTSNAQLDVEYPDDTPLPQQNGSSSLTAKHLVIRQSASPRLVQPGDTVTFTDTLALTQFGEANSLVITDVLPDGFTFAAHQAMTVNGGAVVITPSVSVNAGITTLTYDVHAVTGNLAPGTTIAVAYTATVDQAYAATSQPVLANDNLQATASAEYSLTVGATSCTDGSASSVGITSVSNALSIVNPQAEYAPDDVVTLRHSLSVPSGDTDSIVFETYLPLPVFDVSSISTTFGTDIVPAATDTLALTPANISVDAATNKLRIVWPNVSSTSAQTIAVDIRVAIEDDPFADDLFLTTLFLASTANTPSVMAIDTSPVQLHVRAPELTLTYGIAASDNSVADASLISASPVDSDIFKSDAGDSLSLAITVENSGGADAHDAVVTAPAIAGLTNISIDSVLDGAGTPIAYTGNLLTGLTLTNPLPKNDGTPGTSFSSDTAIITYSADIDSSVNPNEILTSTASVNWSSASGAVSFPTISDSAVITMEYPAVTTSLKSVAPKGNPGNLVVGDIATYETSVTLPEGSTENLNVFVALPAGFEYVDASLNVDTTGFAGTVDTAPTITASGAVNSGQSISVAFDSPAITSVTNDNIASNNSFTFTVNALVTDSTSLSAIDAAQNTTLTANLTYKDQTGSPIQDSASVDFTEHNLAVTSSFSPASGLTAGDTVTVTINLANNGTAPAYDIVVTDILNADLFDVTSAVEGTTPAGYSYSFVNPQVTYTASGALAVGASEVFTYSAVVKDGVVTGSSYASNVSATGDSQAGVSGNPERDSSDTGSATASVTALSVADFSIIDSSESWTSDTGSVEGAIGEVLTYRLTVTVPEGVSSEDGSNAIIDIDLPAGTEYLTGTALIRAFESASLQGSNLSGGLAPIPESNTVISPVINGSKIGFDLGSITNSDNDANDEQIILTFSILVKNTSDNERTNVKTLTANINYNNVDNNPQKVTDTAGFTVVEADLAVSKLASPSSVTGGELVTFTTVITNSNSTNASRGWEWEVSDLLPARLQSPSLTSATLSRGSKDLLGCFSFIGNTLASNASCVSGEHYLDPGETITLVYTATVDPTIGFEEKLTNTLSATVTSLPGARGTGDAAPGAAEGDTGERTGSGNDNDSAQKVNDLIASDSVTVTAGKPTINLTAGSSELPILDKTTVMATMAIPVGTTDNFVFTYDLPTGLTYTGTPVNITTPASNFTASLTPETNLGPADDPLIFDFGALTNSHSGAQDISIEIEVEVDNILANQAGTSLSIGASASYDNASTPPTKTLVIDVIEANLDLSKTITSGATGSDAGDTVSYKITLTNTSTKATAYRVSVADLLPAELLGGPDGTGSGSTFANLVLTNIADAAVLTNTSTPLASADAQVTTTNNADDTLTWPLFNLPPTASVQVDYDVVIANSANAGDSVSNTVTANYNSLEAGGGRDSSDSLDDDDGNLDNYGESVTQAFTVDSSLSIQQGLSAGQADSNFAIGETVSYDIRIDLIEGMSKSLVLTDTLPGGLSFVSSSIIAGAHISYSGAGTPVESPTGTLTYSFGDVTNTSDADAGNDFFIVRLVAQVEDEPGNVAGVILNNTASVTSQAGAAGPDIEPVTIAEPNLLFSITPSLSEVSLGDKVSIAVVLDHDSSSADAFETSFDINIPAGLTYTGSSHVGDGSIDSSVPGVLSVDMGSITLVEDRKSFTFEVTVDSDTEIDKVLSIGISNGVYSSLPGTPAVERDYSFGGSTSITTRSLSFIDVSHSVVIAVDDGDAGVLEVGDILEYTVVITNKGPAVSQTSYSENIPGNTTYVATTPATTSQGSIDVGSLPNLAFDIGAMNTNDVVTLNYRVSINSGVTAGTQIRAQGAVDSELTVPELSDSDANDSNGDQATIIYVQDAVGRLDALYIQQTAQWTQDLDGNGEISPSDTMKISYFIQNISSSELTNVTLAETLPVGVTYVAPTSVISGANIINVSGSNVDVTIASLAAGQVIVAEYQVTIDDPLFDSDATPTIEQFTHTAIGNSDQTDAVTSDSNGNQADGSQPVRYTAVSGGASEPDVDVYLDWSLVNDLDGDGLVDPDDQVLYQFTIVNSGSATAVNSRLADAIPANTTVIANSGFTSQGVVVSDAPFALNIGDITPGSVINAGVIVTIDSSTADGTVVANQGILSGTNFTDVPSDDNADASDGKNPTLFSVSITSSSGQPQMSVSVVSSTLVETAGNDFIQGEEFTLEVTLNIPTGRTDDLTINVELPTGLAVKANSAKLKRLFDTGLTASLAPVGLNTLSSNTFVDATSAFTQSGQSYSVVFGSVINSDADSNDEQYVLRLELLESGLVPTLASENYPVRGTFSYVDNLNTNVTSTPVELPLSFLNRLPSALDDNFDNIAEDSGSHLFDVLVNDFDIDTGHVVNLSSVATPASGSKVSVVAGKVSYTPAANFNGVDTLTYTIADNAGGLSSASVTVNVSPVNDKPVAQGDTYSVSEGKILTVASSNGVKTNDSDVDNDPLTVILVSGVSHGSLTLNGDGSFVYQHNGEESLSDSFSYRVSDGSLDSNVVMVTISIAPVNDAPDAINDMLILDEDTPTSTYPLVNDIDVDDSQLSVTSAQAAHGTVVIGSDGSVLYTPEANYHGEDQIAYCVEDASGLSDCAVIFVTVTPVNDRPVALNDIASTIVDEAINISVLGNDSDVDGDSLTIVNIGSSQANVQLNADNTLAFMPPEGFIGELSFSYTVSDGVNGDELTAQAMVTVTVKESEEDNLPPVAVDDSFAVNDWQPIKILPLANDSDPENELISLLSASVGMGQIDIQGNEITYTPVQGLVGEVVIEYLIADPEGLTDVGRIRIDIDIDEGALFPVISLPDDLCGDLSADADALYTRLDIGTATAVDNFGNPLPVSIINNNLLFPPGNSQAFWQAVDSEGRVTIAAQNICVRPLVSFKKDQTVLEGEKAKVGVYLNGPSETYPLVIDYQLSGTVVDSDYVLASGEVVIESGTEAELLIDILQDDLIEGDETLTLTLGSSLNRASQSSHTLTISEGNIAPKVSLTASQAGDSRLTVSRTGGEVIIDSTVYDANVDDTWEFSWDSQLTNISQSDASFTFEPSELDTGVYQVNLLVTDNGVPALDDKATIYVHVVDALEVLTDADSDGDLIPDNIEGYQDTDGDGTPDYLDRVDECNVLFEKSETQNQYLVEGDPGVCLRRGELTFNASTGGALITEKSDKYDDLIPVDQQAINVGGIMDFIAYGLPDNSQLYRIVTPLRSPIPMDAVYRKYRSDSGWGDFVEDADNSLWSTRGEPGYCPPTGSDLWQPGLNEGDWCVQLIIRDGGANDDDGITNGSIADPGFVGTRLRGNRAPVAINDSLTVKLNEEVLIDILVNDSDPDGDDLRIVSVSADFGSVVIDGGSIVYQAPTNIVGQDTVRYGISDGNGGTGHAVVNITILANQAPVAIDDNAEVLQGEQVAINVLTNDYDPDGDDIGVISAAAQNGTLEIGADGIITYISDISFSGNDSITYVIEDAFGQKAEAVIHIEVTTGTQVVAKTESSGGAVSIWSLLMLLLFICISRNGNVLKIDRANTFRSA